MNGHTLSAAVYGGLLVLLLGASWAQYTAEPTVELDGKIVLVAGDSDDIETIRWVAEGKDDALIERRSDDRGEYLWVTYTRYKPAPKPPAAPDTTAPSDEEPLLPEPPKSPEVDGQDGVDTPEDEPAEEPELIAETQVFKAGEKGDDLLTALSPLLALRKLDAADDKLATIGLDAPTESVEIVRKGRTVKLDIGGEVYGTRDRYVRNSATAEIYLVDDEVLRPLKYARTRLPDRTLWAPARVEITRVTLQGSAGSLVVGQDNAEDPDKARWIPDGDAQADEEQLQTWMDKALKLKGSAYAAPDDPTDGLEPQFSLMLETKDGPTTTLSVTRDADGAWWGESEHTRGRVKLLSTQTSALAEDVEALTGS